MVSYIRTDITFSELQNEIREICKFQRDRAFTIKFIDDENDPCTISSQEELDEAIYLYEINKDTKITIHSKSIVIDFNLPQIIVRTIGFGQLAYQPMRIIRQSTQCSI